VREQERETVFVVVCKGKAISMERGRRGRKIGPSIVRAKSVDGAGRALAPHERFHTTTFPLFRGMLTGIWVPKGPFLRIFP
jgi:hypothetical protein